MNASPSLIPPQTVGQAFTVQVASFTDNSSAANLANFQAQIDWADNTITSGTITFANGRVFTVTMGRTTYTSAANFLGTVTILNDTNGAAPVPFSINVASSLTVTGININAKATAGLDVAGGLHRTEASDRRVVSLDDRPAEVTTSSGSLGTFTNGDLDVIGTHTYGAGGTFQITTTVQVLGSPTNQASGFSQAIVISPTLSVSGVRIFATQNNTFNGVVAGFTDTAPGSNNPGYTASINWGDGIASDTSPHDLALPKQWCPLRSGDRQPHLYDARPIPGHRAGDQHHHDRDGERAVKSGSRRGRRANRRGLAGLGKRPE